MFGYFTLKKSIYVALEFEILVGNVIRGKNPLDTIISEYSLTNSFSLIFNRNYDVIIPVFNSTLYFNLVPQDYGSKRLFYLFNQLAPECCHYFLFKLFKLAVHAFSVFCLRPHTETRHFKLCTRNTPPLTDLVFSRLLTHAPDIQKMFSRTAVYNWPITSLLWKAEKESGGMWRQPICTL